MELTVNHVIRSAKLGTGSTQLNTIWRILSLSSKDIEKILYIV